MKQSDHSMTNMAMLLRNKVLVVVVDKVSEVSVAGKASRANLTFSTHFLDSGADREDRASQ